MHFEYNICNLFLIHEINAAHKLVVGNFYFRARNLDLCCTFLLPPGHCERLGGIQKIRQQHNRSIVHPLDTAYAIC